MFGFVRQIRGPCLPTGGVAAGVFDFYAIDRAHRQTQFAARACRFNDGVHAFVRADDGVYWAGFNTQGAAYAPVLINPHHTA